MNGVSKKEPKYRWKTTKNHVGSTGKHWKLSEETKIRQGNAKKGMKHSETTRRKISQAHTGKKRIFSEKHRANLSAALKKFYANGGTVVSGMLGKKASPETIQKLSDSHKNKPCPWKRGANNYFWKGGITPIHAKIRMSLDYKMWRDAVFERDMLTCKKCGKNIDGKLRAHHICNFSDYPELRFEVDNGITFCVDCHVAFHKSFGKQNNNQSQINAFCKNWTESHVNKLPGWEDLKL